MKKVAEEYGVLCSLSYKQTHGITYDQQQPDIMVCRNGDLPIHIDLAVAHCRRDAKQDTLLTLTLHKEVAAGETSTTSSSDASDRTFRVVLRPSDR
jgi:hypothetical protein